MLLCRSYGLKARSILQPDHSMGLQAYYTRILNVSKDKNDDLINLPPRDDQFHLTLLDYSSHDSYILTTTHVIISMYYLIKIEGLRH